MGDDNTDPSGTASGRGSTPQDAVPADDAVGYGRPPKHTRFEKGKSGNPKGRPRGSRSLKTLAEAELFRTVEVKEAQGRTRKMPLIQAALRGLGARSIKDNRAASIALGLLDRLESAAPPPDAIEMKDLLAADREIMKRYGLPVAPDPGEVDDDV